MEQLASLGFLLLFFLLAALEQRDSWDRKKGTLIASLEGSFRTVQGDFPALGGYRVEALAMTDIHPDQITAEIQANRQEETLLRETLILAEHQILASKTLDQTLRTGRGVDLLAPPGTGNVSCQRTQEGLSETIRQAVHELSRILGDPSIPRLLMMDSDDFLPGKPNEREGLLPDFQKIAAVFRNPTIPEPVRSAALFTLGQMDPDAGWPIFLEALDEKSQSIRLRAVEAIGKTGRPETCSILNRMLGTSEEPLQIAILKVLTQLPTSIPAASLFPLIFSGSRDVADAARQALMNQDDSDLFLPMLFEAFENRPDDDKIVVLEILADLVPQEAAALLNTAMESRYAPLALAGIHVSRKLSRSVDRDRTVRVIEKCQTELEQCADRLDFHIRRFDHHDLLRREIANDACPERQFLAMQILNNGVIAGHQKPDPKDILPALNSSHPPVRGAAILLLGRMGETRLIAPYWEDISEYVRSCVVEALGLDPSSPLENPEERLLAERSEEVQYSLLITGLRNLSADGEDLLANNLLCFNRPVEQLVRQGIAWREIQQNPGMELVGPNPA